MSASQQQQRVELTGSYVYLPDLSAPERKGVMVWPNPADPAAVQHRLRYGDLTPTDRAVAASFMAAYSYMVLELPQRVRNQRVSELRRALSQTTTERSEG